MISPRKRVGKLSIKKAYEKRTAGLIRCRAQLDKSTDWPHFTHDWPLLHCLLSTRTRSFWLLPPLHIASELGMLPPSHSNSQDTQVCILISCEVTVCLEPISYLDWTGLLLTIVFVNADWSVLFLCLFSSLSFPYPPHKKKKHPYTSDNHTT